jgi:hypothetical protein
VTSVHVNVSTYAYTHVATTMLRGLRQIVREAGLDPARLIGQWEVLEDGISTWLSSRHLRALVLEVFDPSARSGADLVQRFDFTIDYGYYSDGDGELWHDPDSIRYAVRKAGACTADCSYRVVADTAQGRPDVRGWNSTTLRSTAGFSRHTIGTAIGGGSLGAGLGYYTRR